MGIEHAIVTGVAGFVGSHLAERLLALGVRVRGLDCLTRYYDLAIKERNLAALRRHPDFEFHRVDLASDPLDHHVAGVDVVFHQAAQPGVRSSWSEGFTTSVINNVVATQRLLEAVKCAGTARLVYASSSSVYGDSVETPMREDGPTRPHSPYGVTKLSAEQLCSVYADNWGVPTVALRYFTVYGPRQRPDMATHRLIQAALTGTPFPLYASADHIRDFTFVQDIVEANLLAASAKVPPGAVTNLAGGAIVSMSELIAAVEVAAGRTVPIDEQPGQAGDVRRTEADLTRARDLLGWRPRVPLHDGLAAQVDWHRHHADLFAGQRRDGAPPEFVAAHPTP